MKDFTVIRAKREFELKRRHDRIKTEFEKGLYTNDYMKLYRVCYMTARDHLLKMVDLGIATRRNIYSLNGIRSKILYKMK